MIPGDFDFRAVEPDPPLGALVTRLFYARGVAPHRRERILPAPGAVLLVVLGAPLRMTPPIEGAAPCLVTGAWLTGPHERPIINEPTGETFVVGASFATMGLAAFVEGSVAPMTGSLRPVGESGDRLGPGETLRAEVIAVADPAAMIGVLDRWLTPRASVAADHARWARAIARLTSPDLASIASVQRTMGVSRRHFAAEIRRRSGLLPKSLQRIARMRRLLEELDARRPIRWSREVLGAGYFDQPHAIREFRRFTGLTPTQYVERRRAAWGRNVEPGEAPQFVPEVIR